MLLTGSSQKRPPRMSRITGGATAEALPETCPKANKPAAEESAVTA